MTKSEWNGVVKILNAMYEDKGRLMFETPEKIKIWYECLSDLDYQGCCEAVKRHALISEFQPKIADIRKQYVTVTNTEQQISEAEAWNYVRAAIRDSIYHADEQFEQLPDIVKRAVASPDRLREWGQLPSDTVTSVVRAEFRRGFESAQNSVDEERKTGAMGKAIAEKLAKRLGILDGERINPDADRKYLHTFIDELKEGK